MVSLSLVLIRPGESVGRRSPRRVEDDGCFDQRRNSRMSPLISYHLLHNVVLSESHS
jgi:hypothetical protein